MKKNVGMNPGGSSIQVRGLFSRTRLGGRNTFVISRSKSEKATEFLRRFTDFFERQKYFFAFVRHGVAEMRNSCL
jgi:hypothetical protein